MAETRPYGVLLDDTTAFYIPLLKAGSDDFAVSADWTPAAGDVKVAKDDGAAANIANLPTYVASKGWKFILTATELTCKQITVRIIDSATKAVKDDGFNVETYGNPSAMYPDATGVNADVQSIKGVSANADALADLLDGTGLDLSASTVAIDATTLATLVDLVVDEVVGSSRPAGSVGSRLTMPNGVAQAGSGASTIVLASTEPATDDIYNGRVIAIFAGTGVGQKRRITDYVGSTKTATVDLAWTDTPDTTSRYAIV